MSDKILFQKHFKRDIAIYLLCLPKGKIKTRGKRVKLMHAKIVHALNGYQH